MVSALLSKRGTATESPPGPGGTGLQTIGPFKVEKFITTDGYKFLLPDREWVAFRASGTEPLIRCYIEARSTANLKKLETACRQILAV